MATIKLKSVEDQQKWLKGLIQQMEDHRRWRNAAENCLDVLSPGSIRNSFTKGFRQGSLYDQTPIIGTTDFPEKVLKNFWLLLNGLPSIVFIYLS